MLIKAWVMRGRVECTQSSGSPLFRRAKTCLHIQNEREESTVKIFEQSIQTPCGLYRRQAAREQLLRMGNEEMAETRRRFSGVFFVMGCQNGFDLLRELLIINCIICFLLRSSQEMRTPNSSSEGRAQFIASERAIGLKLAVQAVSRWQLELNTFHSQPRREHRLMGPELCQRMAETIYSVLISTSLRMPIT